MHASVVLDGQLFIGVQSNLSGARVWSFDGNRWSWLNEAGFGGPGTRDGRQATPYAMTVCDNKLYVAVSCDLKPPENIEAYPGCQVWRYDGGTNWTKVNADGFGDKRNLQIHSMCVFGSKLYAGVYYHEGEPGEPYNDYKLLRYEGDTNWTTVMDSGVGMEVAYINSMLVHNSKLYMAVSQFMQGVIVKCYDGVNWQDVSTPVFGCRNIPVSSDS